MLLIRNKKSKAQTLCSKEQWETAIVSTGKANLYDIIETDVPDISNVFIPKEIANRVPPKADMPERRRYKPKSI